MKCGDCCRVIIDFPVTSAGNTSFFYTGFLEKRHFRDCLEIPFCLSFQERLEAKEKGESVKDDGPHLSQKELEMAEKVSKYNVSSVKSSFEIYYKLHLNDSSQQIYIYIYIYTLMDHTF